MSSFFVQMMKAEGNIAADDKENQVILIVF